MDVCICQNKNPKDFFQIWCNYVEIFDQEPSATMILCRDAENHILANLQVDLTKATLKRWFIYKREHISIRYN